MGTNYFCKTDRYELTGFPQTVEPGESAILHIGKSSAGWTFALHAIPELELYDLEDWLKLWQGGAWLIYDDAGAAYSVQGVVNVILARFGKFPVGRTPLWYRENAALPGPHGLARRLIGSFCVRHGEGAYDVCVGEFS